MTLKKSALPAALAVLVMISIGTGQVSAQTTALTVDPTSHDFGDVSVGIIELQEITITNNTHFDIEISDVNIDDPKGVFSYENILLPFTLGFWDSEFLDVFFKPSSADTFEGTLNISYSIDDMFSTSGTVSIRLVGNGVSFDLELAIDKLVGFTADALISGDLVGKGKGRSADNRELVFVKWIVKAQTLIQAGEYYEAHHLLSAVLRKVDGAPSGPADFVEGTAAGEIADQIWSILAALAG